MRHGQTHANVSGELDTAHPGLDLTDLGRAQAVAAARALADEQIDAASSVQDHQCGIQGRIAAANDCDAPTLVVADWRNL